MTRIYVKGLDADKTNYQNLIELKKIVKGRNKEIRHLIVFYDTFIGSHEARKKHPERFSDVRYVTGSIFEADYISRQREKTLNKLGKEEDIKKIKRILLELKRKTELLHLEKIEYTHGLYEHLYQIGNNFIEKIGSKLEKSLIVHKRIIKNPQEERKIKHFFYREADCMSEVLFRKLDQIQEYQKYIGV